MLTCHIIHLTTFYTMDLKMFRKSFKLSQSDLAQLFDCSVGHISNIENGTRSLTGLQIRLLIDKYGYDVVSQYAEPSELPASASSVNIDMHQTKIEGNHAPVQNGDGNSMSPDAGLIQVMQKQADHISELLRQQDRLISLMEKMKN